MFLFSPLLHYYSSFHSVDLTATEDPSVRKLEHEDDEGKGKFNKHTNQEQVIDRYVRHVNN